MNETIASLKQMTLAVFLMTSFVAFGSDTYHSANYSGQINPGNANVQAPFTSVLTQGDPITGNFVYDDQKVPGNGSGFINVDISTFPDIANIPAGTAFHLHLGNAGSGLDFNYDSTATNLIQYNNGSFNGFVYSENFTFQGNPYQINVQGAVITIQSAPGGVPTGGQLVGATLNIGNANLTNVAVYTPPTGGGTAPSITTNPVNQTVNAGQTASFTAAASGSPAPTVQWQVSTNGGSTFTNIGGATSTTLSFSTVAGDNNKQYRAVFTNAAGSATTNAATLTVHTAPSVTTNPTNKTVNLGQSVTFTAAASGSPAPTVQWQVSTNGGSTFTNIGGATSTTLTFTTAATDTGNEYRAVFTNVVSSANTTAATLTVVNQYTITAPANATAGTAFNVTVTAKDNNGNTATGYTGTVHFSSSDGAATVPVNSTLTNGTGTFSVTLKTAGNQTVTATDTVTGSITKTTSVITVGPGAATHFTVSAPGTATAGIAFNITVTAFDAFNNVATGYAGTVNFTSSDAAAVLPANTLLTNGVGTLSATLKTAGSRTITATDTVSGSITGTSASISVSAAAATHLSVVAPANATAGVAFNFTVTAKDQFNNTATGYAGTLLFTGTDASGTYPANSTLTNGVGTFSATVRTSGSQTLTATDTVTSTITGTSNTITVVAAAATHYTVSAPLSSTAGIAFNITVTAFDQFNNTATGYSGTVHFTSTDGAATLPGNSTLTSGVGTFTTTLKTAGSQTLTATDTVSAAITGTSGTVIVSPAGASHFAVSAPASSTAGTAFAFTVTALDAFNNTDTAYSGTVHFTSSDALSVLPGDSTLTAGTGTLSATLETAGNETLTATDTVTSSITGTSNSVNVSAAAATHLLVSAPGSATAGTSFSVTVTAQDQFNNTASGYVGIVHFTSTDATATLPADSPLNGGVGTFSATLKIAGNQTLTGTDTVTSTITGTSNAVAVNPSAATHYVVSAPAGSSAGVAFNITVTAQDQFNNTATGYAGTVHFTTSDAQSVLPVDSTLTGGVGTFSATLKTVGTQTITATDTVTSLITGVSGGTLVTSAAATHFTVSAPASTTSGVAINVVVTALDPFGNTATAYSGTVHFTSTDAQAGLSSDSTLTFGVGTFATTLKTSGNQTVAATDTVTGSITGTTGTIAVTPAAASQLVVSAVTSVLINTPLTATVTARDPFGNVATAYTGTAALSSSDAAATGLSSHAYTPGDAGAFAFTNVVLNSPGPQTLTAKDGALTGSANVTVNQPAAFTSVNHTTFTAGVADSFTISAGVGFPAPTLSLSGTLPAGITFNAANGALGGTATAGGTFNLVFTASNGIGSNAVQNFTFTVNPAIVVIAPATLPAGKVGAKYNQTISANGGTAPYSFTVISGTLPAGLTLSSAGTLTGTPTSGDLFAFTVKATDASTGTGPYSATQSFSVAVPPGISTQPAGISIFAGLIANLNVSASGAALQYQWYLGNSGDTAAPVAGATSATFTTPVLLTTTNFWVRVTDAGGATDSVAATVTVTPAPPPEADSPPVLPSTAVAGQPVIITIGNITSLSGTPTVTVDFGDGTTPGSSLTHTYTTPGVYTVTITLTSPYGQSETFTQTILVGTPLADGSVPPAGVAGILIGKGGQSLQHGGYGLLLISHLNPAKSRFIGKLSNLAFANIPQESLTGLPGTLIIGTGALAQKYSFTLNKSGVANGNPGLLLRIKKQNLVFSATGPEGLTTVAQSLVKTMTNGTFLAPVTITVGGKIFLTMEFQFARKGYGVTREVYEITQ